MRALGLDIDRTQRRSLTAQLEDALRRRILTGAYPGGSVLPKLRDLAQEAGVSLIVVTAAVRRLAEEGLVVPRKHVGTIVAPRGAKVWQGRVLFVCPTEYGAYYPNALAGGLAERLVQSGYLFSSVLLQHAPTGGYDFSQLDFQLRDRPDLVVQLYAHAEVTRHLRTREAPFAVIRETGKPPAGSVGDILVTRWPDLAARAGRWRAAGVRTVEVAGAEAHPEVADAVRRAGLDVRERVVPADERYGFVEGVQRAAQAAYAGVAARGLPDLLFFTDDYFAAGALTALLDRGLRAPEDFRAVTHANARLGPVYPRTLARFEMDPHAQGLEIAAYLLGFLRTGAFGAPCRPMAAYRPGETLEEDEGKDSTGDCDAVGKEKR